MPVVPANSHFTGVLDMQLISDASPSVSSLLHSRVPSCPEIIRSWDSGDYDDWNVGFQECYDLASRQTVDRENKSPNQQHVTNMSPQRRASNITQSSSPASLVSASRSLSQLSVMTETTAASGATGPAPGTSPEERQVKQIQKAQPSQTPQFKTEPADEEKGNSGVEEEIKYALQYASFYGDFLNTALKGTKRIIDEYCLPESLQSQTKLTVNDVECSSCTGHDDGPGPTDCSQNVYAYRGLVFRVVSHNTSELDQPGRLTPTRAQFLKETDHKAHKASSAEYRAQYTMQSAANKIDDMYADLRHLLHAKHVSRATYSNVVGAIKKDPVFGPRNAEVSNYEYRSRVGKSMKTRGMCHFRPVLSTVVDYCGYRVQVLSPLLELDPAESLVNGFTKSDSGSEVFVDASPHVQHCLAKLSKVSNISMCYLHCSNVTTGVLSRRNQESADDLLGSAESVDKDSIISALTKELQAHYSPDGRHVYLLNLHSLLPCDLPSNSTDLVSKVLRPEMVKSSAQPLSALTFRYEAANEMSELALNPIEADLMKKQLKINGLAIEQMYTEQLPRIANLLDSMLVLPIDSYSLTCFLHAHGVCCRHLGILFDLSKTNHVRQMLLLEAIGRSCKSILKELLRAHTRGAGAVTISALLRGRSSDTDYEEHQKASLRSRQHVIIGFYNVVFGSNQESHEFWSGRCLQCLLFPAFESLC
jgi:hypothetical protein